MKKLPFILFILLLSGCSSIDKMQYSNGWNVSFRFSQKKSTTKSSLQKERNVFYFETTLSEKTAPLKTDNDSLLLCAYDTITLEKKCLRNSVIIKSFPLRITHKANNLISKKNDARNYSKNDGRIIERNGLYAFGFYMLSGLLFPFFDIPFFFIISLALLIFSIVLAFISISMFKKFPFELKGRFFPYFVIISTILSLISSLLLLLLLFLLFF